MDINWCAYCETQLEEPADLSDSSGDEEDSNKLNGASAALASQATAARTKERLHAAAKPKSHLKRNHSSGKMAKSRLAMTTGAAPSTHSRSTSSSSTASPPSVKQAKQVEYNAWQGLYCSAECMAKDEQRSRLAIAHLEAYRPEQRTASVAIGKQAESSHSGSSHSYRSNTSDEIRSNLSSSSLRSSGYPRSVESSTSSHALPRTVSHRQQPPPAMNFSSPSTRNRSFSRERGSSDSLASISSSYQYSPNLYGSMRASRNSGLRTMTPIRYTLDETVESTHPADNDNAAGGRPIPVRSPSSEITSQLNEAATLKPFPSMDGKTGIIKSRPSHSRGVSVSSMRNRTGSGLLPSRSIAVPVLSQGSEGNAVATLIGSPREGGEWGSFNNRSGSRSRSQSRTRTRPGLSRGYMSTASIPCLSCSPSSPNESQESEQSDAEESSASTAPSEFSRGGDYLSHKRLSNSHLHLSNPHAHNDAPIEATLHDYAMLRSHRPIRAPSTPSLPSLLGSSPPILGNISRSYKDSSSSSGFISKIIQATAQQRFSSPSPDLSPNYGCLATGEQPAFLRDSVKRVSSSASVSSLPHHMSDLTITSDRQASRSTQSTSAPKGWQWDSAMPQYKAMPTRHGSDTPPELLKKKRLFYFDPHSDAA